LSVINHTLRDAIARAICRVRLNGGDPDQPAMRWNGTAMEPQEFEAWRDDRVEAEAVLAVVSPLIAALNDAKLILADVSFVADRPDLTQRAEAWFRDHDKP
jgi:hypothetical protein